MDSDYAFIELYRQGVMVKEQEMEINDTFDYSVTVDEREYLIITFDLKTIFKGTSRNVVEINHVYQFETPSDVDPVETDTEVDDNGVSDSNDVASDNDSNRSDNNDVSPNNDSDKIEESNTQIPDNNQTVDIEDSTSDNGNSIFGIGVFLVTVMIVIIWADVKIYFIKYDIEYDVYFIFIFISIFLIFYSILKDIFLINNDIFLYNFTVCQDFHRNLIASR